MKQIICAECKAAFEGYFNARYCRACAAARAVETKRLSYAKIKGVPVPGEKVIPCEGCGAPITAIRITKRLCEACRLLARKETVARYEDQHRKGRPRLSGDCYYCGKPAEQVRGGTKTCGGCLDKISKIGSDLFYYYRKKGFNVARMGEPVVCEICKGIFPRRGAGHRYCDSCKPLARVKNEGNRGAINNRMRTNIARSLKGKKAGRRWETLVGYTLADLMQHLERQFSPGMTWENLGEWHIDHRVPLSSFKFESPEDPDFRAAWALTNLQPLWAADNQAKYAHRLYLL
jgi:hypothetical protein